MGLKLQVFPFQKRGVSHDSKPYKVFLFKTTKAGAHGLKPSLQSCFFALGLLNFSFEACFALRTQFNFIIDGQNFFLILLFHFSVLFPKIKVDSADWQKTSIEFMKPRSFCQTGLFQRPFRPCATTCCYMGPFL